MLLTDKNPNKSFVIQLVSCLLHSKAELSRVMYIPRLYHLRFPQPDPCQSTKMILYKVTKDLCLTKFSCFLCLYLAYLLSNGHTDHVCLPETVDSEPQCMASYSAFPPHRPDLLFLCWLLF